MTDELLRREGRSPALRGHEDLLRLHQRSLRGELTPVDEDHRVPPDASTTYRKAAVLALFALHDGPSGGGVGGGGGPEPADPSELDLFLVQRSPDLSHHPGQIALPGGGLDPGEGPEQAALRETEEETGIDRGCIDIIGSIGEHAVPVSGNLVTPVLGWSTSVRRSNVWDRTEVLHPLQVSVADLLNPENRATVQLAHFTSAGFLLPTGWVWGFTGNLLSYLFDEMGWTRPWDTHRVHQMTMAEARGRG